MVSLRAAPTTKQEIPVGTTKRFPQLRPRLPRFRKPWMSEDYGCIFDAVGLALTFFFQFKNKYPDKKRTKFVIKFCQLSFLLTAILFLAKQVSENHRPSYSNKLLIFE